jgi:hypothetical protein
MPILRNGREHHLLAVPEFRRGKPQRTPILRNGREHHSTTMLWPMIKHDEID